MTPPPLRLGAVKYLNALPLIAGLSGDVLLDHPSALCTRLTCGDLDAALVSSYEFLRNPIYRVVDDVGIVSKGPVYSVVLAHRGELSEIEEVALDPASETSINLLRSLLAEIDLTPKLDIAADGFEASSVTRKQGRLLIGDQAIHFRAAHHCDCNFWDLGEQWERLVGLPFVYALWLVRPEVKKPGAVADVLRATRDRNLSRLEEIAETQTRVTPEFCLRYFRDHLRYQFGEAEKLGLATFQSRCEREGILTPATCELRLV